MSGTFPTRALLLREGRPLSGLLLALFYSPLSYMLDGQWHQFSGQTPKSDAITSALLESTGTVGETGFRVSYPGNKAVSHVLRQLLVLLQLFEEDAARERKAEWDISAQLPRPSEACVRPAQTRTLRYLHTASPLSDNVVKGSFKYVGTNVIKMLTDWLISAT